mgnify:CR=1 FL=1
MKLIFLGPPGAGKGTHAVKVSKSLGIPHISTGDILREALAKETPVGLKAKAYMEKGELVPDSIIIQIVLDRIKQNDCKAGYLLDGFPRTIAQAEGLDKKLTKLNGIDSVIYFSVDEEVLINRITGRRLCSNCGANYHIRNLKPVKAGICDKCKSALYQRTDDNEETIRKRFSVFKEQSLPLVEYYKKKNLLKEIEASYKSIDEVNKKVLELLAYS